MVKTVKATYKAGLLALVELLPLADGEIVVTVTSAPGAERASDAIRATTPSEEHGSRYQPPVLSHSSSMGSLSQPQKGSPSATKNGDPKMPR